MTTDYGRDAVGALDLEWDLAVHDDGINAGAMLDRLVRRVSTRYGALFYDPSWTSLDLYDYIGSMKPPALIQSEIARVIEADEAVRTAIVVVTVTGESLTASIRADTESGPFGFVISVDRAANYIFNEGTPDAA